ncbi:hypothetical protein NBEOAGPD_1494 [Methylobacterium gregans]|uniref:Uncharacterized protein n=1 Tax=Methylobacterium gregans TaxID=374424 RepID=A0AA37HMH1_9HYPH|nr:hypothetical protein NBEOAGPD_1494 [Methylobacterium gregans]
MTAEHHEADGERRRQDKADGPPEEGPDRRRQDHGDRREPGRVAVEQRLDHVAGDRLDHHEQDRGGDHHAPAGIDRGGEDQRQHRGDDGADIGHEAQDGGEHAEQGRARHTDDPEAEPDHHAERDVERELGQEEARQPARGVVDRGRGAAQVAGAGDADRPVPQVLALEQDEDREEQDQAGRGERVQDRPSESLKGLQHAGLRRSDLHGQRVRGRARLALQLGLGRGLERVAEILDHVDDARERAGVGGGPAQGRDLVAHGQGVARQVGGELGALAGDETADTEQHPEGHRDDEQHRERTRHE